MTNTVQRLCPDTPYPEAFIQRRVRAEVGTHHAQAGGEQAVGTRFRKEGAVGRHGHVDAELRQVRDVRLEALVQQWLAVAMQRDDAHIEARAEVGDDELEVLKRHDASPVDEMIVLVALWAVDAPEVTRVDGLDGEEHGLAPDPIALEQIAEAGGDSIEVPEVMHGPG